MKIHIKKFIYLLAFIFLSQSLFSQYFIKTPKLDQFQKGLGIANFTYWTVAEYSSENLFTNKKNDTCKPIWSNQYEEKQIENIPTYFKFYYSGKLIIYNEEFYVITSRCKWKIKPDSDEIFLEVSKYNKGNSFVDLKGDCKVVFVSSNEIELKYYPESSDNMVHTFKLEKIYPKY